MSSMSMTTNATSTADDARVKRKVALVAGYIGTGYHGVQLNDDVNTIENELRRAILLIGALRESNFEDLAKIDWSRSSRTDKGVHASTLVFSGKLLVDDGAVDPSTGRVHGLAEALNDVLPPTIRIFTATRVNKKFAARKSCVLREYEYYLPCAFVKASQPPEASSTLDMKQAVEVFCNALREYEGIHDFHNFTKSRSYFYKRDAKLRARRLAASEDVSLHNVKSNAELEDDLDHEEEGLIGQNDNGDEDEDEEEDEGEEPGIATEGDESLAKISQFADEQGTTRRALFRHRRTIYSCSGSMIEDFKGEPYVRISIVGQAFLLNQIRCMIGGALALATGVMSQKAFDAALHTDCVVQVPIAPAEGLLLRSSSFGGKLHSVSLYEDLNTPLATEGKEVPHRVLLTSDENVQVEAFRNDVIYPEIVRNWRALEATDRWRAYLDRCYENIQQLDSQLLESKLTEYKQMLQARKAKQQDIVQQNRREADEVSCERFLMPRQFTTRICAKYFIAPGIFTSDLRRGIVKHFRMGKLPVDISADELIAYVEKVDPKTLANEGRELRLARGNGQGRRWYTKKKNKSK